MEKCTKVPARGDPAGCTILPSRLITWKKLGVNPSAQGHESSHLPGVGLEFSCQPNGVYRWMFSCLL